MTTNVFKVKYSNGHEATINSTDETAEQMCNSTFGLTIEQAAEHGCSVELIGPFEPPVEAAETDGADSGTDSTSGGAGTDTNSEQSSTEPGVDAKGTSNTEEPQA